MATLYLLCAEQLLVQPDQADQLFTGLTSVGARLVIPKFKTETMLNLNTPLKEMGITQAFNPSSANFSGISPGIKTNRIINFRVSQ